MKVLNRFVWGSIVAGLGEGGFRVEILSPHSYSYSFLALLRIVSSQVFLANKSYLRSSSICFPIKTLSLFFYVAIIRSMSSMLLWNWNRCCCFLLHFILWSVMWLVFLFARQKEIWMIQKMQLLVLLQVNKYVSVQH